MNERVHSLAERLGLADRLLTTCEPERITALPKMPIDLEKAERQLAVWREEAHALLTTALD